MSSAHSRALSQRGISSVGAFALVAASAVVGGLFAPRAYADELPVAEPPATAPAPGYLPAEGEKYTIGEVAPDGLDTAIPGMLTTVSELQEYGVAARTLGSPLPGDPPETMAVSQPVTNRTVLEGDAVTWVLAIWIAQGGSAVSTNMDARQEAPEGNYVPKFDLMHAAMQTSLTQSGIELVPVNDLSGWANNSSCSPDAPDFNGDGIGTVYNGWCMASKPGVYSVSVDNASVAETPQEGLFKGMYRFGLNPMTAVDPQTGAVTTYNISGPNMASPGANTTYAASVKVINPSLEVVKEVCETGSDCDPSLEDDPPVADGSSNKGPCVDAASLPAGTTNVTWRITAINTGNTDLTNVHVATDSWSYLKAVDQGKVGMGACADLPPIETLPVDGKQSWTCDTPFASEALDGALVNGINLNATVVGGDVLDPYGVALQKRFQGNPLDGDDTPETGIIGSNTDIARVEMANPGIKLTKWVCEDGTGCDDPSAADLATLTGYNPDDDVIAGAPAGGWVKAADVPYSTDADWLIIATNTGNTHLANVKLSKDQVVEAAGAAAHDATPTELPGFGDAADLGPGESVVWGFTTDAVINSGAHGAGADMANVDDATAEPAYIAGDDVVNTAQATAEAVTDDGTALLDLQGAEITVLSNESTAEVRAVPPEPGLKLTKWVCEAGTGCDNPVDADLATLAGYTGDGGMTAGAPAAGWVKATDVDYATGADWLIIATNTGNTHLTNVALSKEALVEAVGKDAVPVEAAPASGYGDAANLAPGESVVWTFTTPSVINSEAHGTGVDTSVVDEATAEPSYAAGGDVVNIAQATARVADAEGTALADDPMYPMDVISNESTAEVRAIPWEPGLKLTKWVCSTAEPCAVPKAGSDDLATLGGSATTPGAPAGGWEKEAQVPYKASAQWLIVVTNIGNTFLSDVTIPAGSDVLTGTGHGASTAVAPESAKLLAPGASATFTLSTDAITNSNPTLSGTSSDPDPTFAEPGYNVGGKSVVNEAQATGSPSDEDGAHLTLPGGETMGTVSSNKSSAEVNTVAPASTPAPPEESGPGAALATDVPSTESESPAALATDVAPDEPSSAAAPAAEGASAATGGAALSGPQQGVAGSLAAMALCVLSGAIVLLARRRASARW